LRSPYFGTGRFWTRLAAASGIGFAGVAVAAYVIGSVKDLPNAAAVATRASDNIWGTWVLLVGLAGVLLLWFSATSTARLRMVEGGSRRISMEHLVAGAAIAALLFVEVAVQFAARTAPSGLGLGFLATSIVNGPVLTFAGGVYVLSAGVVGTRAGASLPWFSGVIARVSLLLGVALIAAGGLWLFRDYAWLNDTAFFSFVGWVFVRSGLGTFRWIDLDIDSFSPISLAPATRRVTGRKTTARMSDLEDTFAVPSLVRSTRTARKPARRGGSATTRRAKPAARKAGARKPAARKAAPRKPAAPRPTPAPPPPPRPATEGIFPTEELETDDLGRPEDQL